jgi:hypothetical protein
MQLYSGLTPDVPGWGTRHQPNATHRLSPAQCGEFAVALEGLRNLVNLSCRRGKPPSAEEVRRLSARALNDFTDLTRQVAVARLSDYRRMMLVLAHLADSLPGSAPANDTGHLPSISDCVWLSPECYREIRFAAHRHIVVLGLRALNGGQCASVGGSVDEMMWIAELMTASCIVLGDVKEAQRLLTAVLASCGEMGRDFFLQLVERCDLCVTQVDPARGAAHSGLGVSAHLHRLKEFESWAGSNATASIQQPVMRGSYSEIGGDGVVKTSAHATDPVQAHEARIGGVQLDGPCLVLNRAGDVLKPPGWSGLFQHDRGLGPLLLNSGSHGVTLGSAIRRSVNEPVLFPACLGLLGHGGFAQWLLRGLSPICWALAHGRLEHCKLMLPQGMPGWMEQSLALCGIGEDQIVRYGAEESILVEDARIMTANGQPVAAWLNSLRIRMQAGLNRSGHPRPAPQLLYLSGRDSLHRFIINDDRLCAIARAHGFQVLAPNAVSVAQQVALFLGARGVVSPHRAAHAAMIFAPPGTRMLVLEAEFGIPLGDVGVAVTCGQSYRSLKGATEPFFHSLPSLDDAPYHVDEHLFEQQLRWVVEGTDS